MNKLLAVGMFAACLLTAMLAFAGDGDDAATQPAAATQPNTDKELFEYSGQVLGPDGKPVAGATVGVYENSCYSSQPDREIGKVTTGADGNFSIKGRPTSRHNEVILVCYKDGMAVFNQTINPLQGLYIVIPLDRPASICGVVVDENGKPVAGATVCPLFQIWCCGSIVGENSLIVDGHIPPFVVKTDDNGRFHLTNLPPKFPIEAIYVKADGMGTAIIQEDDIEVCGSRFDYGNENIRLQLHREFVISGRLVEKGTGRPVGSVALEAFYQYGGDINWTTLPVVTGEDGGFRIEGLYGGAYYFLRIARQPLWSMKWAIEYSEMTVAAAEGEVKDVELSAVRCGLAEFTVADEDGKPALGYPVTLVLRNESDSPGAYSGSDIICRGFSCSTTDDDGKVTVPLSPGKYAIYPLLSDSTVEWTKRNPDNQDDCECDEEFNIQAGETVSAEIRLGRETYEAILHGIVVDKAGRPVPGTLVTLAQAYMGYETYTDKNGEFAITLDKLHLARDDQYPSNLPVLGLFIAQCFHRNLAAASVIDVENTDLVRIVLSDAVAVAGKVETADGKPPVNGRVAVYPFFDGKIYFRYLEKGASVVNGQYVIKCLPAGLQYRPKVKSDGYGYAAMDIEVPKDAGRNIEGGKITLPKQDKFISGIVVDTAGSPIDGAVVRIEQDEQNTQCADVGKDGKFKFRNLIAGAVRLYVYDPASIFESDLEPGYESVEMHVNAGDEDIKIVLKEKPEVPGENF